MTFCYADPPYLGTATKHYAAHHPHASTYDTPQGHATLIDQLVDSYPDGWALSMSSTNLHTLLPLCPPDVRVMAWVKPFASFKPNVNPAYAWEPVIIRGGRPRQRGSLTLRDWVAINITLKRGLVGAKPQEFFLWIFGVLGCTTSDQINDLFPGTGGLADAWSRYCNEQPLLRVES